MNKFDKVYELVVKIPKGKITTYGALAKILHINPRTVGFALNANKNPEKIPCHRVINSQGKISKGYAFGGPGSQKKLLLNEGVEFDQNEKVNLMRFGFYLN